MKLRTGFQPMFLGFLLPGLFLECLGTWLLSGENPNWLLGLPLQVFGLAVLWVSFPPKVKTTPPPPLKKGAFSKRNLKWSWFPALGVLLWCFSSLCFFQKWWVLGVFCALGFLAVWFSTLPRMGEVPPAQEGLTDTFALVFLLAVAVLFRFPFLWQNFAGFQPDEANVLLGAIDVLQGKIRSPFAFNYFWSYMPHFFLAPFLKLFGITLAAGRGGAAVFSLFSVYFFYRWCRLYYGVLASFLSSVFFSYCWWNLYYSLSPFQHLYNVVFEIPAFFFLARALREGKRKFFAASGFFLALAFIPYNAGRILPLMMAAAFAAIGLMEGKAFLKTYWKSGVLLFLCFLGIAGPFLVNCCEKPTDAFERLANMNIFKVVFEKNAYALPLERFLTTFYTFFWPNDQVNPAAGLRGTPCLDPFIGFFTLLGLAIAIYRFRKRENILLLTGLVFGILPNAFSAADTNAVFFNGHRCFVVLPFLGLLAAQGLDWAIRLTALYPKAFRVAGILLLGLGMAYSIFTNANDYFFKFRNNPENRANQGADVFALSDVIKSLYPQYHIVAEGRIYYGIFYCNNYDTPEKFLTYGQAQVNEAAPLPLPIRAQVTKDVVLMFTDWEHYDDEKEKVRRIYPRAVWKDYTGPFGERYLTTVVISQKDIQKLQKGMTLETPLL